MQPDDDHELRSIDTLREGMPDPTLPPPREGLAKGGGLRYRKRAAFLLAFYLPLLLLPWILTAIMMFRPINFPSYFDPNGTITPRKLATLKRWQDAARILRTIAATLGLPIVSALLAHGVAVYTQRRKPGQNLNALQMFTLADRTWMDIPRLVGTAQSPRIASTVFLWLAAGLIFITAFQPPLQSILIQDETKQILTCRGHPNLTSKNLFSDMCHSGNIHGIIIGYDPEPVELANCPQALVIQRTRDKLIDVSKYDTQIYLWPGTIPGYSEYGSSGIGRNHFGIYYGRDYQAGEDMDMDKDKEGHYFASAISNVTSTGIYREHAARMDSKVTCANVTASNFPKTCRGDAPFETRFSHLDVKIDICVEGDSKNTPWTTSRDKQKYSERLWLNVSGTIGVGDGPEGHQYTLKCESTSRRGWFELPNPGNNHIPGPLLDVWPSSEELLREFNDYAKSSATKTPERIATNNDSYMEWTLPPIPDLYMEGPYIGSGRYVPTPGPLMTAALAMFGHASAFHAAATAKKGTRDETALQICRVRMPFSRFEFENELYYFGQPCRYDDPKLQDVMAAYFAQFYDLQTADEAFEVAMFIANEALLTTTATDSSNQGGREIYSSPGDTITKPKKSIPGLVIISFLMFLQVAGLVLLVVFIYSTPTWTGDLDADAMAQIGAQIKDLGEPRPELRYVSGLVGVVETQHSDDSSSLRTAVAETTHLALGGEGIISAGTIPATKPEPTTPTTPTTPQNTRPPVQRNLYG